jgi:ADP-heptose:LPS heptosyltransferase
MSRDLPTSHNVYFTMIPNSDREDERPIRPTTSTGLEKYSVFVHMSSGIGNIILATPMLIAISRMGFAIDLLLDADYPQTAELFRGWGIIRSVFIDPKEALNLSDYGAIIPAFPPFYWARFARYYRRFRPNVMHRPPDDRFYQDEQEYYLSFARRLGYPPDQRPFYSLPITPSDSFSVGEKTLVLAPGCKSGMMAAKRWPYFTELARRFEDVAVVGAEDDLKNWNGTAMRFPDHVRLFVGRLTSELMAAAGIVLGNDNGLAHMAAATGSPTVMLFGPTPDRSLGHFPPNVIVMRSGLACEPCWFISPLKACAKKIDCLKSLSVESVEQVIRMHFL